MCMHCTWWNIETFFRILYLIRFSVGWIQNEINVNAIMITGSSKQLCL